MGKSNYFKQLDKFGAQGYYSTELADEDSESEGLNFKTGTIGTTTNPMGNTLQSLKSRIRQGAKRVEFSFIRPGSGNAQQVTPEMFGSDERRDMRELLKINKMKGNVHAPITSQSLAGFDSQQGTFSEEKRNNVLREIKRSIDFASEATTGGAVVFHMHEWKRPLTKTKDGNFKSFEGEGDQNVEYVIDKRTGEPIRESVVRKDTKIFRPQFKTAKDEGLHGEIDPQTGRTIRPDDWIDADGNVIPRNSTSQNPERLLDRVPKYDEENDRFEVKEIEWDKIEKEAQKEGVDPRIFYARTQLENQALQVKSNSLLSGGEDYQQRKEAYQRTKELYRGIKNKGKRSKEFDDLVEQNIQQDQQNILFRFQQEKRREPKDFQELKEFVKEDLDIEQQQKKLKRNLTEQRSRIKRLEQVRANEEVQLKQIKQKIQNLETVENYGTSKTAKTIASAANYAKEVYEERKDKYGLEDPIYVAPENWNQDFYGSHPDEYKNIIDNARNEFKKRLIKDEGHSEDKAKELANKHIKGTLDIGHMNTLRSRFKREDHESLEEYEERFNDWLLEQTEELVEEGYVGHIHLNDNFGYEDEHVTPGQGNVPMKEFLKRLEKQGMDDIIVEQGSFNELAHIETKKLANGQTYGPSRAQRYSKTRRGHFGQRSPAMFMAGSYAPSNDFTLWSGTPLE